MIRSGRGPGRPGIRPVRGTRRSVGFSPKTPQKCAGRRIEADRSVPISKGVIPDASAAAGTARGPRGVPWVVGAAEDWITRLKVGEHHRDVSGGNPVVVRTPAVAWASLSVK